VINLTDTTRVRLTLRKESFDRLKDFDRRRRHENAAGGILNSNCSQSVESDTRAPDAVREPFVDKRRED
jgi:hypothetical protein